MRTPYCTQNQKAGGEFGPYTASTLCLQKDHTGFFQICFHNLQVTAICSSSGITYFDSADKPVTQQKSPLTAQYRHSGWLAPFGKFALITLHLWGRNHPSLLALQEFIHTQNHLVLCKQGRKRWPLLQKLRRYFLSYGARRMEAQIPHYCS